MRSGEEFHYFKVHAPCTFLNRKKEIYQEGKLFSMRKGKCFPFVREKCFQLVRGSNISVGKFSIRKGKPSGEVETLPISKGKGLQLGGGNVSWWEENTVWSKQTKWPLN